MPIFFLQITSSFLNNETYPADLIHKRLEVYSFSKVKACGFWHSRPSLQNYTLNLISPPLTSVCLLSGFPLKRKQLPHNKTEANSLSRINHLTLGTKLTLQEMMTFPEFHRPSPEMMVYQTLAWAKWPTLPAMQTLQLCKPQPIVFVSLSFKTLTFLAVP